MFRYGLHTVSCRFPYQLGMEDGRISDSQITASSFYGGDRSRHGRLNRPIGVDGSYGGWCPSLEFNISWIQVDIGVSTLVAGVIMQGRGYHYTQYWVSKYKVQYGNDGETWKTVMDVTQQEEMVRIT